MLRSVTTLSGSPEGLPCRVPSPRSLNWMPSGAADSTALSAPVPLPRHWPCAAESYCAPPGRTTRPTRRSPPNSAATAIPSASGANASSQKAWRDSRTPHAPAGPGAFPPDEQLAVVAIATSTTAGHDRPVNGWTLDEIAATIINEAHARTISRATVWRILDQVDLKPHKSVYWLNSHDPDFEAKAKEVCRLYLDSPRLYQHGRLVLCCDEKTGMQVLDRVAPTRPAAPGRPERRELESIRLGTRTMITTFVVPTGEVVWDLGATRHKPGLPGPRAAGGGPLPRHEAIRLGGGQPEHAPDLELCEVVAYLNGRPFRPRVEGAGATACIPERARL